jgi:hypothetical protein
MRKRLWHALVAAFAVLIGYLLGHISKSDWVVRHLSTLTFQNRDRDYTGESISNVIADYGSPDRVLDAGGSSILVMGRERPRTLTAFVYSACDRIYYCGPDGIVYTDTTMNQLFK